MKRFVVILEKGSVVALVDSHEEGYAAMQQVSFSGGDRQKFYICRVEREVTVGWEVQDLVFTHDDDIPF